MEPPAITMIKGANYGLGMARRALSSDDPKTFGIGNNLAGLFKRDRCCQSITKVNTCNPRHALQPNDHNRGGPAKKFKIHLVISRWVEKSPLMKGGMGEEGNRNARHQWTKGSGRIGRDVWNHLCCFSTVLIAFN